MRVNHPNTTGTGPSADAARTQSAKKTARPDASAQTDARTSGAVKSGGEGAAKAELSSRGKEFARAKSVASAAPEVREDRVASLKKQIADGTYKVDAERIADRMVDEHLRAGGA